MEIVANGGGTHITTVSSLTAAVDVRPLAIKFDKHTDVYI
jgi:hypothetical protein